MKLDKDTLQKHHFWLLLGLVVPVVLVGLCILLFSVAGDIDAKKNAVTKAKTDLEGVTKGTPKNQRWLTAYEAEKLKWTSKRDEVHQKAWEAQSDLMTWPGKLQQLYQDKYFGDPIDTNDRSDYAEQLYKTQFGELYWLPVPFNKVNKKEVNVQYRGGVDGFWQLLQPVQWMSGEIPTTENMWMAQEDMWVKRELLRVVRQANELVSVFREVTDESEADKGQPARANEKADDKAKTTEAGADKAGAKGKAAPSAKAKPLAGDELDHKRFRNHFWELDLVLARNAQGSRVLRGTLTNISKRQQLLGVTFIVRVKGPTDERGPWLHVDGEPLAAGKSTVIKEFSVDQAGPEGLFGVEQAFNWRTVPVKRIDMLALSYPSNRNASRQLMPPNLPGLKPKEGEAGADATGGAPGGMMPGGPGGMGPMGPGMAGPGPGGRGDTDGGPGGMRGMGMLGGGMMGGGMDAGALRLDRYIDVTPQVRRMPVAMVVIVDQAHIEDFLTAFANSRLRIQTTQVHWQHTLEPIKPPADFDVAGGAMQPGGGEDRPGGYLPRLGAQGGGSDTGVPRPGSMGAMGPGDMRGPMGRMAGGGRMMPGGSYRGMNLGMGPGETDYTRMPGYGMMGASGYLEEGEQETQNLVELVVYGIASLYERYPPKPPEPDKPAEGDKAAEKK